MSTIIVVDLIECTDDECENGGTCLNDGFDVTCICPLGFTGPRCEVAVVKHEEFLRSVDLDA